MPRGREPKNPERRRDSPNTWRKGTHGPGRPRSDFASPGNGEAGADTVVLRVALVMRGGQIGAELTPDKGRDLSPRLKDGRRGRTRVSSPKWWTGHDY